MEMVMKTALLCWELGAGLGHLTPIKQMSLELINRGYKVWIAAREMHNIHHLFYDVDVNIIPAPVNRNNIKKTAKNTLCYADLLYNVGYKDKESLANHIQGWQSLFMLIKPGVIFFDHSPTAIIASQQTEAIKILMGTPFSRPHEEHISKGYRLFSVYGRLNKQQLASAEAIEKETLNNINFACHKHSLTQLNSISELFSSIEFELFSCLKELDHFPSRPSASKRFYLSTPSTSTPQKTEWPAVKVGAKKIFAYLTPHQNIVKILNGLIASQHSAILYARGQLEIKQKLPSHIKIITQPTSMSEILQECDLVISNGNLNTVQQTSLAGIPQLAAPIQLEQHILTDRLQQQGIAERFDDRSPLHSKIQINRLISDKSTRLNTFKAAYSKLNQANEIKQIFDSIFPC